MIDYEQNEPDQISHDSIVALSTELRDVLMCLQNSGFTARIDQARVVLEEHGRFNECPNCGHSPTANGIICRVCAGVIGDV